MAQVKDRTQAIREVVDNGGRDRVRSDHWNDPNDPNEPELWDQFEEVEEEFEEEEIAKEPSYEIYEPPPPEERDIGTIIRDSYGFYKKMDFSAEELGQQFPATEEVVYRYTLCNSNGMLVQVITLGASITAIRMPDNKNIITDITLGLNSLDDYMSDKNQLCFGSTLGRFNGVIFNGEIKLGKKEFLLSTNLDGIHHDKGGFYGFDKAVWQSYVSYDKVIMTHMSPHLDEGYPGDIMVQISFHLRKDNCLVINTTANTSQPTILSLGQHVFFNLAGHESGPDGLKEHSILVNADKYVKVDRLKIPTGQLENVGATYFDLRVPRPVWKAMSRLPEGGYDHVFCLTKGYPRDSVTFATRLVHPNSGRYLEIMTDMPALYINTGTSLPNTEALPPLEAQLGFIEEVYPKFCREEKMKEKEIKELQAKMAAKQTWPRQEVLPEASEVELPVPAEPLEKKVLFRDKRKEKTEPLSKDQKKEEKPQKQTKNKTPEIENEEHKVASEMKENIEDSDWDKPSDEDENDEQARNKELKGLKFLKDAAESDTEEHALPRWLPPQPIIGRKGVPYKLNGGICLMTQEYPDPMRHKDFPKPVLKPGDKYSRTTIYKFGIIPARGSQSSTVYL